MHQKPITRRKFLTGVAVLLGGLSFAEIFKKTSRAEILLPPRGYFPLVTNGQLMTPTPVPTATTAPPAFVGVGRVAHVRAARATTWDAQPGKFFFEVVDQGVVNSIVEAGLRQLYGSSASWAVMWGSWFNRVRPGGYVAGQTRIAIKVNFNGMEFNRGNSCDHLSNSIDSLPQPLIGLINTMNQAGVRNSDITIYDATLSNKDGVLRHGRRIPNYFRNALNETCPGVRFIGDQDGCGTGIVTPTYGKNSGLIVSFNQAYAPGLLNRKLVDVLSDAAFLINVPILKAHSGDNEIPFTAGFKNHMGSINYVLGKTKADMLHGYFSPHDTGNRYHSDYNPLVAIYRNANVGRKTVMTMADGLFGSSDNADANRSWQVFGNQAANSLFFSVDPVALDCILADIVRAEGLFSIPQAYDYLFLAEKAGLGKMEGSPANPGGNPLMPNGSGYSQLHYLRTDL